MTGAAVEKLYKCPSCENVYKQKRNLKQHEEKFHSGANTFQCNVCLKLFLLQGEFQQHEKTHNVIKNFHCGRCTSRFQYKSQLKAHSTAKTFRCKLCKKKFRLLASLSSHLKVHSRDKKHQCGFCRKKFLHKRGLEYHLTLHSERGNDPRCEICNCGFKSRSVLNRHMKRDHGLKDYDKCIFCSKTINCSVSSVVEKHLRSHIVEAPYFCKFCCNEFRSKDNLKAHLRTHESNPESTDAHECIFCGRTFPGRNWFHRHILSHIKERPLFCTICTLDFTAKETLTLHLKSHSTAVPSKNFSCELCPKKFRQSGELTAHIRCHLDEKPFKCPICGRDFRTSSNLGQHHQRIHTGRKDHMAAQ